MEYWKEEKTPAFPPSVPPLAGLRRTGAKASGFATAAPRQDGVARETRIKRNGRMEYWSIGVMEYWEDGMMGKEKSLPASLYTREEIGEKDGTNVEARRKGA